MINHTGERKYKCPYEGCSKAYSQKCRIEIHKRTHTGVRPYKCDFLGCGKSFNEKGNLLTHKRKHNGNKPFKCTVDYCQESFRSSLMLKNHIKDHGIDEADCFKCYVCGKRFTRYSTLQTHKIAHEEINQDVSRSLESKRENIFLLNGSTNVYSDNFKINVTNPINATNHSGFKEEISESQNQFEFCVSLLTELNKENPDGLIEILEYLRGIKTCGEELLGYYQDKVLPTFLETVKLVEQIKLMLSLRSIFRMQVPQAN